MNPDTARRDSRKYGAAKSHADASPNAKRAAAKNGVTLRAAQRWAKPEAGGSPQEAYDRYLETVDNPFRAEAHNRAVCMQRHLARLSDNEIKDRIAMLNVENATLEGIDNANRCTRGVSARDRAVAHERDAAVEIELAALWREADARGLSEQDVLDWGRV